MAICSVKGYVGAFGLDQLCLEHRFRSGVETNLYSFSTMYNSLASHRWNGRFICRSVVISVARATQEPEGLCDRAVPIENLLLDCCKVTAYPSFGRVGRKNGLDPACEIVHERQE